MKRKIALFITLCIALTIIVGANAVQAEETLLSSKVYAERCEKIHWVADALRSLGFENGSNLQKQALKQCGDYWHEQNDLRKKAVEAEKPKLEFWKTAQMTAYEWDGTRCANSNWPTVGYTVACNALPLGTRVYIDGIGYRTVEDRGATWHSDNWMDLYLGDVAACNEFGVQNRDVYLVK
jgi:3D (Asp-Asp-Asp) domain-containing protein